LRSSSGIHEEKQSNLGQEALLGAIDGIYLDPNPCTTTNPIDDELHVGVKPVDPVVIPWTRMGGLV